MNEQTTVRHFLFVFEPEIYSLSKSMYAFTKVAIDLANAISNQTKAKEEKEMKRTINVCDVVCVWSSH